MRNILLLAALTGCQLNESLPEDTGSPVPEDTDTVVEDTNVEDTEVEDTEDTVDTVDTTPEPEIADIDHDGLEDKPATDPWVVDADKRFVYAARNGDALVNDLPQQYMQWFKNGITPSTECSIEYPFAFYSGETTNWPEHLRSDYRRVPVPAAFLLDGGNQLTEVWIGGNALYIPDSANCASGANSANGGWGTGFNATAGTDPYICSNANDPHNDGAMRYALFGKLTANGYTATANSCSFMQWADDPSNDEPEDPTTAEREEVLVSIQLDASTQLPVEIRVWNETAGESYETAVIVVLTDSRIAELTIEAKDADVLGSNGQQAGGQWYDWLVYNVSGWLYERFAAFQVDGVSHSIGSTGDCLTVKHTTDEGGDLKCTVRIVE